GTKGLGLFPQNADEDYPYFGEFHGDHNVLASALRRRAFRADGSGRVSPIHRTIAEFLAAKFLVHRIREGLPLKRVLALLTGFDGGTLAELRGVYAWLACLCEEESAILIDRDPLGIILYGDAAILSLLSRQLLIKSLRDLAKKNPSFRAENWSAEQFGALVSADLAPIFAQILKDQEESPVFLDCILDAIEHGPLLPELGHDLLKILYDPTRAGENRVSALAAFRHTLPNDREALKTLLEDINEERVLDDNRRLRGILLYALYPATIRPNEIGRYLVQEAEHHINAYTTFVAKDLVLLTNPEELPLILSEVNALNFAGNPDHYIWREFIGHLILQILVHHGETAPAVQLYDWLGKALDQYWQPVADQEETAAIQRWLSSHPTVPLALFHHWLSITPFESPVLEYNDFWARLYNVNPPEGFPQWLLQLAGTQSNTTKADFLFRESVRMSASSQRRDGLTLKEFWEFTRHNDRFRGVLEIELCWNIPTWAIKKALRKKEKTRQRESRRAVNFQ
nr:hypothetical protein [Nitrospirales bacterium]